MLKLPKIKFPKLKWDMPAVLLFGYMVYCLVPNFLIAKGTCYSEKEFEADRGLRLHTDLEVIMLTCRYSSRGQPLKDPYSQFVRQYQGPIRSWQSSIARAYAGMGRGPDEVIDNFRTALANNKSHQAADMGPKNFCAQWADFVPYIASLKPQQVYGYLRQQDLARPTKRPLCGT